MVFRGIVEKEILDFAKSVKEIEGWDFSQLLVPESFCICSAVGLVDCGDKVLQKLWDIWEQARAPGIPQVATLWTKIDARCRSLMYDWDVQMGGWISILLNDHHITRDFGCERTGLN